jgi:hypothetical protein
LQVTLTLPRGVGRAIRYQHYYVLGLEERARLRVEGRAAIGLIPGASRKVRALTRGRSEGAGYVAHYVTGEGVKFAIDARDNHAVLPEDEETLAWSDVYFKSNRWPSAEYDDKVRPVVNGNGALDRRKLATLRGLRATPKDLDVVFVSRVWGGREHNVRLFEELARLDASSELLAIMPHGADPAEDEAFLERLGRAGVATSYDSVPHVDLWRSLARARIVVFRSGMHLCIPWRMIDLLALGACILFDAPPLPQWPVPLERGVHYADMGIERPAYGEIDPGEHAKVGPAVRSLLADEGRQAELRAAAARYYEEHAAPERVAEYLLATIAHR